MGSEGAVCCLVSPDCLQAWLGELDDAGGSVLCVPDGEIAFPNAFGMDGTIRAVAALAGDRPSAVVVAVSSELGGRQDDERGETALRASEQLQFGRFRFRFRVVIPLDSF